MMKKYQAPSCELLVLTADVLMASDDNELALDDLTSILNIFN